MDIESILKPIPKDGEWFSFPKAPEFQLRLRFLETDERRQLSTAAVRDGRDPVTFAPTRDVDLAGLTDDMADRTIADWKGLTVGMLKALLPGSIRVETAEDLNRPVECSRRNKVQVMRTVAALSNWVASIVGTMDGYFKAIEDRDRVGGSGRVESAEAVA